MDQLQAAQPAVTSELLSYGGDLVGAIRRARELVGSGTIPAKNFASFVYGVGKRDLTIDEFCWLLEEIVVAAESGDVDSVGAGARMLSYQVHSEERSDTKRIFDARKVRNLGWRLMHCSTTNGSQIDMRHWSDVLRKLAQYDGRQAAWMAARVLTDPLHRASRNAENLLRDLAATDPIAVMEEFGRVLLDQQRGPLLQITVFRELVAAIPVVVVTNWLQLHGVEAARKLARHLPCPQLDESGKPYVPPLLEFVLREFQEDDTTFRNFCTGTHGFESWFGNAADRFLAEADVARMFLNHPLRRIREWAEYEVANRERMAQIDQREFEESLLD